MCGIFGYTGDKQAASLLLDGLALLEYRGYDSAGISILNGSIHTIKSEGNILRLKEKLGKNLPMGNTGIAHTRWATHGMANEVNAHPHNSNSGRFSIVHNGIIENYLEIKSTLLEKGYTLLSETDTEVLVNYFDYLIEEKSLDIPNALSQLLNDCSGDYSLGLIDKHSTDTLWATKRGAPLLIGTGIQGTFLSSDLHAFQSNCEEILFLEDFQIIKLQKGKVAILLNKELATEKAQFKPSDEFHDRDLPLISLETNLEFEHVTLKEIVEQPGVCRKIISNQTHFDELQNIDFSNIQRIILLGCGTSLHAAMLARIYIEKELRIPVLVEQASEYYFSNPILYNSDLVIGISQSGETADTLNACKMTKKRGICTLGITNTPYSSITQELDACIYLKAGKETGVASTKAFTAQVLIFIQFITLLDNNKFANAEFKNALKSLPKLMESTLAQASTIEKIALKYSHINNILYIGRGLSYPMALEGALKLKELSYIHAEGYQAAELKHGPLALIEPGFPVFLIASEKSNFQKNLATANEILARKGEIIALVPYGYGKDMPGIKNTSENGVTTHIIELPPILDELSPLLAIIPLQLFAFYMALAKGRNVDQPRNLAKSVTVM